VAHTLLGGAGLLKTPRWLIRAAIVVAITATAVVVTAVTVLSTPWGRDRLVSFALQRINARLSGELSIDSVGGTLLGHLRFDGVTLRDQHGDVAVHVNTLDVRYRLRDLLARRFVLRQVAVEQPNLRLVRASHSSTCLSREKRSGVRSP